MSDVGWARILSRRWARASAALRRWRERPNEAEGRGSCRSGGRGLDSALTDAVRVGQRAAHLGYDWPDPAGPRRKVDEELEELDRAVDGHDGAACRAELGDVLFAVVNLARKHGVDPERALAETLERFESRLARAETCARASGKDLAELDDGARDRLWELAKGAE